VTVGHASAHEYGSENGHQQGQANSLISEHMLGGQRSRSHAHLHGQQKGHHSGDYYGDS